MSEGSNLDGNLVSHNVMFQHTCVALTTVMGNEDLLAWFQAAIQDVPESRSDQIDVPELAVLWHARVNGNASGTYCIPFHVEAHSIHVAAVGRGNQCRVRRWTQRRPHERRTSRVIVRGLDSLDDARIVKAVRAQGTDPSPDYGPLGQTLSGGHFIEFDGAGVVIQIAAATKLIWGFS